MRTRPNQLTIPQVPSRNPNTIYRRYRKIFQYLLDQRSLSIQQNAYDKYYVPMPEVHRALYQAVTTYGDSMRCFVGYTGIGKSTILRFVFKMDNDNPVIRSVPVAKVLNDVLDEDDDVPEEDQRSLFIPLFMDARHILDTGEQTFVTASDYFANQLSAASQTLQEAETLKFDESELASFVDQQRKDLLQHDKSLPVDSHNVAKLRGLRKVYPFAYEMMRLKWLLTKSTIQRVILIVDDVESLTLPHQEAICHVIAKSFEWLINLTDTKRSWIANAIISIRPLTYNMIRRQDWFHALYFDDPIGIKIPPDMKVIFEKRFDDACEAMKIVDDVKKSENWAAARKVFHNVYDRVAKDRGNFLVALCNYNVRRALTQFEGILLNRRYFEPDSESQMRPNIQSVKINFSEAAALKALGMGDGTVFPYQGTEISNIFANQMDPSADLLGVLLILALQCIGHPVIHGLKYIEKQQLLTLIESVCCLSEKQRNSLPTVLADSSALGFIQLVKTKNSEGEVEVVELMPKAAAIWDAIRLTSVLTEMFRDDTFVTYSDTDKGKPPCSQELPDDISRLDAAILFGSEIALTERNLVERCVTKHGASRWTATFGSLSISRSILEGINRSVRAASDSASNRQVSTSLLEEFKRRVVSIETILGGRQS